MQVLKILTAGQLLLLLAGGCHQVPVLPAHLSQDWGRQQTFDYHGVRINYYEAGQGPPILLLHGFGGSAYTWRHLIPALAAAHRVFTLELKGYGLSDKPPDGRYAVADQAGIVADFIHRRDLHDLVVVGHSIGGGVALLTYFRVREEAPGQITKLVLIDSAGYPQKLPWFIRLSRIPGATALVTRLLSPRFATALVLRKCYDNIDKITEEQIDTYAYYGSLPGAPAAVAATAKQLVTADFEALIAQYKTIKAPVLLLWGREDQVVPLEVGRQFERDIAGAKLVVIPRCGHIPPEEEPLATRQAIMDFLKK